MFWRNLRINCGDGFKKRTLKHTQQNITYGLQIALEFLCKLHQFRSIIQNALKKL